MHGEPGIESMSLNPDTVTDTWTRLGAISATGIVERTLAKWSVLP
jgi:hypothetical protein